MQRQGQGPAPSLQGPGQGQGLSLQVKDKDLSCKDQDMDKDFSCKDEDKDWAFKDKNKDKDLILVYEDSLRTRKRINITTNYPIIQSAGVICCLSVCFFVTLSVTKCIVVIDLLN